MTMTSLWNRIAEMEKYNDNTSEETLYDSDYEDFGCDEEQRYGVDVVDADDDQTVPECEDQYEDDDQVVPVMSVLGKHECAEACYGEDCGEQDDEDNRVDMTDEMFERILSNVYDTFGPVPFDTEDEWMQIMKDNTVTETRLKRVSFIEAAAVDNAAPIEIFEEVAAEDDAVSDDEDDE